MAQAPISTPQPMHQAAREARKEPDTARVNLRITMQKPIIAASHSGRCSSNERQSAPLTSVPPNAPAEAEIAASQRMESGLEPANTSYFGLRRLLRIARRVSTRLKSSSQRS